MLPGDSSSVIAMSPIVAAYAGVWIVRRIDGARFSGGKLISRLMILVASF